MEEQNSDVFFFLQLLSFFECARVPKALFLRASTPRPRWNRRGRIVSRSPEEALVPPWLPALFSAGEDMTADLLAALELEDISVQGEGAVQYIALPDHLKKLHGSMSVPATMETLFNLLAIVAHAFPTPFTELLWEETELQLWEVVDWTCVPILAVITVEDVKRHLSTIKR
jgi:hypothetical protein